MFDFVSQGLCREWGVATSQSNVQIKDGQENLKRFELNFVY